MSVATCRLDELAEIKLGVKTFLNPFFYVDQERIRRFGIEDEYLEPVFRTGDAQRDKFIQRAGATELRIFLCNQKLDALTGTGAAAYINWASTQRHATKNAQVGGLWKDTSAVKPKERIWYQNQAMPPAARIVLLKAFDEYFAPFILDKAIRVDQRFNQVNPKRGVAEKALIGLLCSTWFVMLCETFGRTAMGQGVLELPTNALRALPVPDLRKLNKTQRAALEKAATGVLQAKRLPSAKARETTAQGTLDRSILRAVGIDVGRIDELYEDVTRMNTVRRLLASGRGAIKREKFAADVDQVADDIAAQLRPLLGGRRFPNDFVPSGAKTSSVRLGNAPLVVSAELMLGQRLVTAQVDGHAVYEASLPATSAELFIRAVEAGQRSFELPDDEADAAAALVSLEQLLQALVVRLEDLSAAASNAVQATLREKVETRLNLPLSRLTKPLPAAYKAGL